LKPLLILLASLAIIAAQNPPRKPPAPDGHWWLSATREQRDGFLIGYFECHSFTLRKPALSGPEGDGLMRAVTDAYEKQGKDTVIASVIQALSKRWLQERRYHLVWADPPDEWDGNNLWPLFREMPGIVQGFLACQIANGQHPPAASPRTLVARVYKWYGLNIKKYPNTDLGPHAHDKLGAVILRAERGQVRP
jgi:hypothetical protein